MEQYTQQIQTAAQARIRLQATQQRLMQERIPYVMAVEQAAPSQRELMQVALADFDKRANAILREQMYAARNEMQAMITAMQQVLAHTDSLLAQLEETAPQ
jgi:hypothetical protein